MKIVYAKTILNIYPHIGKIISQIDDIILKKALTSFEDYSPCFDQCVSIINNKFQKEDLIFLKEKVEKALSKLSDEHKELLEYKYFRKKPICEYENIDSTKRNYFRHQDSAITKFTERLERVGISDTFFEEHFLTIDFFEKMYKIVLEKDLCEKKRSYFIKKKIEQNSSQKIDKNSMVKLA